MSVLLGRTALVTGASRGIGPVIAERLTADGALVAVHYGSNHQAARETVATIEKNGGRAFAVHAEPAVGRFGDVAFEGSHGSIKLDEGRERPPHHRRR